jgi:hypothetical protein
MAVQVLGGQGGYSTSTAASSAPRTFGQEQFDTIARQLDDLTEIASSLEQRFSSVLAPCTPTPAMQHDANKTPAIQGSMSHQAQVLRKISDRLMQIHGALSDMHGRCEL